MSKKWMALCLAASLLFFLALPKVYANPSVTVNIDRTVPFSQALTQSNLELGVTHTQAYYGDGTNSTAVATAESLLTSASKYQNVHIMGFGSSNPAPAPNSSNYNDGTEPAYNWANLDSKMQSVIDSGAVPVITLCCAPDWMKDASYQPGASGSLTLTMDLKFPDSTKVNSPMIALRHGTTNAIELYVKDDPVQGEAVVYYKSGGTDVAVGGPLTYASYYHPITITVDVATNTFSLKSGGVTTNGIAFQNSATVIDNLYFSTPSSAASLFYLDNIRIETDTGSAMLNDKYLDDSAGSKPPGWIVSGATGSATVASETSDNRFKVDSTSTTTAYKYFGKTNWDLIEDEPLDDYFDEFAELAYQVAKRYPTVEYFQIWNEVKGFWDNVTNTKDEVRFTTFYNTIYDKLKTLETQSRHIYLGGPYLSTKGTGSGSFLDANGQQKYTGDYIVDPIRQEDEDFINYWLRNSHGADFLSLDRATLDFSDTNKPNYTQQEIVTLTHWFADVADQVNALMDTCTAESPSHPTCENGRLPIWWSESYGQTQNTTADSFASTVYSSMLYQMVISGAAVDLLWNPHQDSGPMSHNLFKSTNTSDGSALPNYYAFKAFHTEFSKGKPLYKTTSSDPMLKVLANDTRTLLINQHDYAVDVVLQGGVITLDAYETRLIDLSLATVTDSTTGNPMSNTQNLSSAPTKLAEDNFNGDTAGSAPSGWVLGTGTNLTVTADNTPSTVNKSMKLADTSTTLTDKATAQKSFTSTSDVVTTEFSYMHQTGVDYNVILVQRGTTRAVELHVHANGDIAYNYGTKVVLTSIAANTWYNLKIVADPSSDTYDLYVGQTKINSTPIPFKTTVPSLDNIKFQTSSTADSTFFIDNVYVY
jgi:hypothetical protein